MTDFSSVLYTSGQTKDPQKYSGMAFPFGGTVLSTFYPKPDENVLRTSIEMILLTSFGERVMLPEFGSNLATAAFEPNDDMLAVLSQSIVLEAVNTWEGRVQVGNAKVSSNEETITIIVPMIMDTSTGPKEINAEVTIGREKLFNFPM